MKKIIIIMLLLSLSILSGCCTTATREQGTVVRVVDTYHNSYSVIDFNGKRVRVETTNFIVGEKVSCVVGSMLVHNCILVTQ